MLLGPWENLAGNVSGLWSSFLVQCVLAQAKWSWLEVEDIFLLSELLILQLVFHICKISK